MPATSFVLYYRLQLQPGDWSSPNWNRIREVIIMELYKAYSGVASSQMFATITTATETAIGKTFQSQPMERLDIVNSYVDEIGSLADARLREQFQPSLELIWKQVRGVIETWVEKDVVDKGKLMSGVQPIQCNFNFKGNVKFKNEDGRMVTRPVTVPDSVVFGNGFADILIDTSLSLQG